MEMTREILIGPMGSRFHRISGLTPDQVLVRIRDMDRKGVGRKIMADAIRGIVSWMSPSSLHEVMGESAGDVIRASSALLGLRCRSMRSTRWTLPGGQSQTGLEADAAFYIGENARAWYAAVRDSRRAVRDFEQRTPPDLVVEVEVTHFDQGKARHYRDLGVRELWQVTRKDDDAPITVTIIDLIAEGGSGDLDSSGVLPGLDRESLTRGLHLAETGFAEDLEHLLVRVLDRKRL